MIPDSPARHLNNPTAIAVSPLLIFTCRFSLSYLPRSSASLLLPCLIADVVFTRMLRHSFISPISPFNRVFRHRSNADPRIHECMHTCHCVVPFSACNNMEQGLLGGREKCTNRWGCMRVMERNGATPLLLALIYSLELGQAKAKNPTVAGDSATRRPGDANVVIRQVYQGSGGGAPWRRRRR